MNKGRKNEKMQKDARWALSPVINGLTTPIVGIFRRPFIGATQPQFITDRGPPCET